MVLQRVCSARESWRLGHLAGVVCERSATELPAGELAFVGHSADLRWQKRRQRGDQIPEGHGVLRGAARVVKVQTCGSRSQSKIRDAHDDGRVEVRHNVLDSWSSPRAKNEVHGARSTTWCGASSLLQDLGESARNLGGILASPESSTEQLAERRQSRKLGCRDAQGAEALGRARDAEGSRRVGTPRGSLEGPRMAMRASAVARSSSTWLSTSGFAMKPQYRRLLSVFALILDGGGEGVRQDRVERDGPDPSALAFPGCNGFLRTPGASRRIAPNP